MDLNEILGKIIQENKLDNLSNFNDLYVTCRKNGYEKSAEEFVSEIKHIFNDALNNYISAIDESSLKNIAGGKLDFKKILSMPIAMLTLSTPFINNIKASSVTDFAGKLTYEAIDALLPKPKKSSTLPGIVKLLGLVVSSGLAVGVIYKVADYCKKIYDSKNLGECVNNFVNAIKDGELTGSDIYQCYTKFVTKATSFLGKNKNINLPEDIKDINQLQKAYDSLKSFVEQVPEKSKELLNNALEALKSRLDTERLKQKDNRQPTQKTETKSSNLNQNEYIQHENTILKLITDTTKEISEKIQQKQDFNLKYIGEKVVDICYEVFLHAVMKEKSEQKDIPNKQALLDEMMNENVLKNKYDKVLNLVKFEEWSKDVTDNFEQKDLLKQSLDNLVHKCNEWKTVEIIKDNQNYNEYDEDLDGKQLEFYDENDYEEDMNGQDENIVMGKSDEENNNVIEILNNSIAEIKKLRKQDNSISGWYDTQESWEYELQGYLIKTKYCQQVLKTFHDVMFYIHGDQKTVNSFIINTENIYTLGNTAIHDYNTLQIFENYITMFLSNEGFSDNVQEKWEEFLYEVKFRKF